MTSRITTNLPVLEVDTARPLPPQAAVPADIDKVAQEFESLFLNIVFASMRKTVPTSDMFGGGHAEDLYRELLDTEYAKNMATGSSTGIAADVAKQMRASMDRMQPKHAGLQAYQQAGLQQAAKKEKI